MKKQLDETTPSFTEYGMKYTFVKDETQSSESTEDCIAKYSAIIDKIVNDTDLKKSRLELFKAWTGCHKEFLSKHDRDCFDALELSIPYCEKSAIQMTSDIMGEHPQTNHTISSIRKMSRSLVSNLIPSQKQFKRSTEVSTTATEGNPLDDKLVNSPSEQSQNSADEIARSRGFSKGAAQIKTTTEVNLPDKKLVNPTSEQFQDSEVVMGRSRVQPDKKLANPTSEQSQISADEIARSRGFSKGAAQIKNTTEVNLSDTKLVNPTSEQFQDSAGVMGRSRGQPDKKLANPTSVQSDDSAAKRGYARGAAKMPPGSIDLFNKVFIKSK